MEKASLSWRVALPQHSGLCLHRPTAGKGFPRLLREQDLSVTRALRGEQWASLPVLLLPRKVRLDINVVSHSKAGRGQFKQTWGISPVCCENHFWPQPSSFCRWVISSLGFVQLCHSFRRAFIPMQFFNIRFGNSLQRN